MLARISEVTSTFGFRALPAAVVESDAHRVVERDDVHLSGASQSGKLPR